MAVILTKKVCSCSAADERIESRLCTGAATDISCYHKALQPKTTVTGKEAGQETSKKAKKKSSEMEL